jgi:hypothetical protein
MILNFPVVSPIFNINKQKHPALREVLRKCPNLCRDTLGNAPKRAELKGYWRLFGKCPNRIGDLFSNA